MTISKKLKIIALAGVLGLIGWQAAGSVTGSAPFGVVSEAEARVGRPLTPVSVAGATRRTVRRCAAGVYNC
jgi:hypothetical protein